jgi:4'-phosphopantetheinyl transferase
MGAISAPRSQTAHQVRDRSTAFVEAYCVMLDVDAAEQARFASMLVAEEQWRAREYRFAADAARYVARRGRLRELLAARLNCAPREVRLSYNRFGKPAVENTDLRFNLSHSRGVALYVIARRFDVGCDIEWRRPELATKEVAERFFSTREVQLLGALPESQWVEGFFNCWTRKEAFVKALGRGLSYPLKEFDVSVTPGEPAALLRGPPGWSLRSFDLMPGLHAAIAANARCRGAGVEIAGDVRAEKRPQLARRL